MITNDIQVLAPNKPTVLDTLELVKELQKVGFIVLRVIYYTKEDSGLYGPHFVQMVNGNRKLEIVNSYDGTFKFQVDYGFGIEVETRGPAIEVVDVILRKFDEAEDKVKEFRERLTNTAMTRKEQAAFVNKLVACRWNPFPHTDDLTDDEFTAMEVFDSAETVVLDGSKFGETKRYKGVTNPTARVHYTKAMYDVAMELLNGPAPKVEKEVKPKAAKAKPVLKPAEDEPVEEIQIPKAPPKKLFGRDNPKYATWVETFGDLVATA